MTQLSPTALEEAAKAMHGAEPWSSFWSTDDARLLATAAITAYLATAEQVAALRAKEQAANEIAAAIRGGGRPPDIANQGVKCQADDPQESANPPGERG